MHLIPKSVLVTAPTEDVLNLTEAKEFLRVDGTADDISLAIMLKACIRTVEQLLDQKLVTQVWDIYFDDFPYTMQDDWWDGTRDGSISELRKPYDKINLPFGPLQSLDSFQYFPEDGSTEDVVATNYQVDLVSKIPSIRLTTGGLWPASVLRPLNGVKVTGTFGYGDKTKVPDDIKQAILMSLSKLNENRGDNLPGEAFSLPPTALMLLEPYRRLRVGPTC